MQARPTAAHKVDILGLGLIGFFATSGILSFALLASLLPSGDGMRWLFAAGVVFAIPVVIMALNNWAIGVYLLAAVLPFENLLTFGPLASGIKALALLTFGALGLRLLRDAELFNRFRNATRQPLVIFMVAFCAWSMTSMLWAREQEAALTKTGTFVGLLGLTLVVGMLEKRRLTLMWAIIALSTVSSILMGYLLPSTGEVTAEGGRLTRFAAGGHHPNDYAGLLVIVLLVSWYVFDRRYTLARYALAFPLLLGVVASGSRAALVALVLTPILLVLAPRVSARSLRMVLLACCLVAVGFLAILHTSPSFGGAVTDRYLTLSRYQDEDTWAGRWDLWQAGFQIVQANPVAGVGAGNFPYVAPVYSAQAAEMEATREGAATAHNVFLGVASETGLIGVAAFLGVLVSAYRWALEFAGRGSSLGTGLLFGLVAYTVMGLATTWETEKVGYFLFGSILALSLQGALRIGPRKVEKKGNG